MAHAMTNPSKADSGGAAASARRCDFCGDEVVAVRRVALDHDYDRLQKAHREQYACAACFERKEAQRLGLEHR